MIALGRRRQTRLAPALLLLAVAAACGTDGGGSGAGQIIFVPVSAVAAPVTDMGGGGHLQIISCSDAPEGLRVVGTVASPEGAVEIRVSGGAPREAGVRVGKADVMHRTRSGEVGDFDVVLPWASPASTFFFHTPSVDPAAAAQRGSSARCPVS